jgi:hypothetical protein
MKMNSVAVAALLAEMKMTDENRATEGKIDNDAKKQAREAERQDDLRRSREYSDSFRKYLTAAITGGVGILFAIAGALLDNHVNTRWIVVPIAVFVTALVSVGIALLLGEHRSLLRRKDPQAQQKLPIWKMGITWNLVPLALFIVGVVLSVSALNSIEIEKPVDQCPPEHQHRNANSGGTPSKDLSVPNKSAASDRSDVKAAVDASAKP